MSSAVAAADKRCVEVVFTVKFGRELIELTLPLTATVAEVKALLEERTQVRPDKQRLLLNAPVDKDKRRDVSESCTLGELFPAAYLERVLAPAGDPAPAARQPRIKVTAMLIGSNSAAPLVDSRATAEISRLVSTTVEHGGQWYRCSFGKGYLRQTAYVCRTCITEGRADPSHCFCLACAEICHANHDVEEWGVRYCMRCDCCTKKCWKTPPKDGHTDAPRTGDARRGEEEGEPQETGEPDVATVSVMSNSDVSARFGPKRKRSRSSSPLTPKRTTTSGGAPPVSGVRVAAVASAPSPFALQAPPPFEVQAVTWPVSGQPEPPAPAPKAEAEAQSTFPHRVAAPPPLTHVGENEDAEAAPTHDGPATEDDAAEGGAASTPKRLPEVDRCVFLLDGRTGKPPVTAVIPANAKNRYPPDPLKWCYCEDDHPSDDPESGGIVCILCTACCWSTHIQRLYTEQFRRVPCYGDVVQGDTVAFKCVDCDTYVCTPCRLRCHRHHTIDPSFICPSHEEGTDNGAPVGVNFSCGCRGLCRIAETVPEEDVEDPSTYKPMPPEVAIALMDNDVFTGFLCARCMQQNPWLMTNDPRQCYHGELPSSATDGGGLLPVVKCREKEEPAAGEGVFPWHGMIVPVTSFTEETTCNCAPCRAAYERFAPRATEDATEMIVQLHDECDNCGVSLKDQAAFLCETCEVAMAQAFLICRDCNALRLRLVQAQRQQQGQPPPPADSVHDPPPVLTVEGQTRPYTHSLEHTFLEDTSENMYALAGMQLMQSMDTESLKHLQENWDSLKEHIHVSDTLVETFGQIPLSFTKAELEAMAEENRLASADNGEPPRKEGEDD